ncbi:hypothetical protein [Arthrobacter sp. AZCC_0090]|uniref:hypothetical protein n=1 Tax=Arthrobacter sp. AZCC_0090 TaxID=2735881 RepID=UPI001620EB79|nr:hypothetical protein [Arthrobacter sp. AZCC_0090]MBB6403534.1 hypothetical protein [Arthrobacter sp. AZCC_0090]
MEFFTRSQNTHLRARRTAALGVLLTVGAFAAGCSSQTQAGPQVTPAEAPSEAGVPGVTRANAQDRSVVADAMKTATDYYATTEWNLAEISSKYPSMVARSKDSNYTDLLAASNTDKVDAANERIIPLISAKSMDDFNTWMDWQNKVISLSTDLEFWGASTVPGQDLKAKATKDLADARADIEKIRN